MINSIGQSPGSSGATNEAANTNAARPQAASHSGAAPAPVAAEAVTVSAEAHTTARLLGAARDARGVDQGAVDRLGAAIQNGGYTVSANNLARAITGALKELAP